LWVYAQLVKCYRLNTEVLSMCVCVSSSEPLALHVCVVCGVCVCVLRHPGHGVRAWIRTIGDRGRARGLPGSRDILRKLGVGGRGGIRNPLMLLVCVKTARAFFVKVRAPATFVGVSEGNVILKVGAYAVPKNTTPGELTAFLAGAARPVVLVFRRPAPGTATPPPPPPPPAAAAAAAAAAGTAAADPGSGGEAAVAPNPFQSPQPAPPPPNPFQLPLPPASATFEAVFPVAGPLGLAFVPSAPHSANAGELVVSQVRWCFQTRFYNMRPEILWWDFVGEKILFVCSRFTTTFVCCVKPRLLYLPVLGIPALVIPQVRPPATLLGLSVGLVIVKVGPFAVPRHMTPDDLTAQLTRTPRPVVLTFRRPTARHLGAAAVVPAAQAVQAVPAAPVKGSVTGGNAFDF